MVGGDRAMNVAHSMFSFWKQTRSTGINSNMYAWSADIRVRLSSAIPMVSQIEYTKLNGASSS